jgi:hypothetical protein
MRWRRKSKGVLPIALAAALLALTPARAANGDVSQANQAAAQALFDQGRRLLDEGKYAEACAKFESSQRLDPGTGTLLNLATCNERLGKLATAWTLFNEALSLAIRDGRRDRMSFAREHIVSIEPQLPHLTVAVRASGTDGLSLTIDGAPLGKAAWGVAAPVDPGDHVVEATASGKVPFRATVKLAPTESRTLEVPALDDDPEASAKLNKGEGQALGTASAELPAPPGPTGNGTGNATRRLAGEIALGAGAVALGIGTYFGLRAMSIWSDANANCTQDACSAYGESRTKDARSAARAADVALGIGVAAVGAGVVLVLTAASGQSSQPAVGRTPERSGRHWTVRRTPEGSGRHLTVSATLTAYAQGGGLALHGVW